MRTFCVLAVLFSMASLVQGQPSPQSCSLYALNVPTIRVEGWAEPIGPLVIECPGDLSPQAGQTVNVQVFLNTEETSRLLNSTTQATEAMLLVNEPVTGPAPLGPICQTGDICPDGTRYYQGQRVGPSSVVFAGVKIAPDGLGRMMMRIVNLRANAAGIGLGPIMMPSTVAAFVTVSGTAPLALENSQVVAAFIQSGLRWEGRKADNTAVLPADGMHLSRCVANNEALALNPQSTTAPEGATFVIRIAETYPTAFLPQSIASSGTANARANPIAQSDLRYVYNSESMFYEPNLTPGPGGMQTAGLARYATRFMVKLSGIPAGVAVHAPIYARLKNSTNSPVRLIMTDAAGDSESFVPIPATSAALGTYVSQASTYVYEVTTVGGVQPFTQSNIDLPFYVAHTGKPYVGSGTIQATVSFAPVFNPDQPTSISVPRFVPAILPQTVATIDNCPARPMLSAAVTGKAGAINARVWSVTLNNAGDGEAQNARLTGLALQQTYGVACTPVIASAMPIAAGTIAAGGSAVLPVTIDFSGCAAAARFKATIGFTADNATPSALTLFNQFR